MNEFLSIFDWFLGGDYKGGAEIGFEAMFVESLMEIVGVYLAIGVLLI